MRLHLLALTVSIGCAAAESPADTDPAVGEDVETDVAPAAETDAQVEPAPCGADVPAVFALGVGNDAFVEVSDGEVVALETYGQGGRHVPLSLQVHHTPRFVGLDVTLTRVTDGQVLSIDASGTATGTARYRLDVATSGAADACVVDGGWVGLPARLSGAALGPDASSESAWAVLCGAHVRVETRLVWTRCVRVLGDSCSASEDVVLAEDAFEAVLGPSEVDACAPPEAPLTAP